MFHTEKKNQITSVFLYYNATLFCCNAVNLRVGEKYKAELYIQGDCKVCAPISFYNSDVLTEMWHTIRGHHKG